MKSCVAGWNPSKLGWNLRRAPQMKLNPSSHPAKVGFHREAISPNAVGFIPSQRTDLVEKATKFCRILSLFLGLPERILNPASSALGVLGGIIASQCAAALLSTIRAIEQPKGERLWHSPLGCCEGKIKKIFYLFNGWIWTIVKSNEILRCRMKSKQVWMKSSAYGFRRNQIRSSLTLRSKISSQSNFIHEVDLFRSRRI